MFESGEIVGGRFRLEEEIARGGMGAVWRAHHTTLEVPCAVKFISEHAVGRKDARGRFKREARAAARLRGPNVVQIYDFGMWRDVPYIAMELLEGEDLFTRLDRAGTLDELETVDIVSDVASALTKAHELGIVHRDLKPENIFLVGGEPRPIAKVLDFGIAKAVGIDGLTIESTTKSGAILGTPYYMSPEQADGTQEVDHRTDLWALAVIAYECLVGEPPFISDALGNLLVKIMRDPLPVPSHACSHLPRAFDGWWLRAASRRPDQRFQSAQALLFALCDALEVDAPATRRRTLSNIAVGAGTLARVGHIDRRHRARAVVVHASPAR